MMISNIIGCTGAVIFILLISAWAPIVGALFSLLIPLPFLFYASKLGLNQGLKTVIITLVIVSMVLGLAGYPHLILFCLEFGIVGLILSEIFRKEYTFGITVLWGTVLMLVIGAVFLFFIGLSKGMGPVELILNYFQTNINIYIDLYEEMGLDQGKMSQLREFGTFLTNLMAKIYPALFIVSIGFTVWINIVISKPLFRLTKVKYPDFGQTDRWQAPEFMVWGVIAAGFSLFFPITGIKFIALNCLIVFLVIYVFHGLAIVIFFFNKYRIPPWARFAVYALIIVQQIFIIVLATMGLFDQWIDFRKIHKEQNELT